jgi:hypothetical protein
LNAEADAVPPTWGADAFVGYHSDAGREPDETGEFTVLSSFLALFKEGVDADDVADLDDDDPPDFSLETTFELVYALEDASDISKRDINHFAFVNGTYNAWPYWREIAQSMTVRMGLAPLVPAPFRVPSKLQ